MNIEVPDSVRRETTLCPHDFSCIRTGRCGDREICKVDYSYGGNVLRLACDNQSSCPYHVAFGYSKLCTCPVRDYLHTREHCGID